MIISALQLLGANLEEGPLRSAVAAAILMDKSTSCALLQLLAVAARGDCKAVENAVPRQLTLAACDGVGSLLVAAALSRDAALAAAATAFALAALKMQTLQALARQVVTATRELRQLARGEAMTGLVAGQANIDRIATRVAAAVLVRSFCKFVEGLAQLAKHQQDTALLAALQSALDGSALLEHVAHAIVVLPGHVPARQPYTPVQLSMYAPQAPAFLELCTIVALYKRPAVTAADMDSTSGDHGTAAPVDRLPPAPAVRGGSGTAGVGASAEETAAGAAGQQAAGPGGLAVRTPLLQLGRCVRHAVISMATCLLSDVDGQGIYGLPYRVLPGAPSEPGAWVLAFKGLLAATIADQTAPDPCLSRRTAVRLLLRAGCAAITALQLQHGGDGRFGEGGAVSSSTGTEAGPLRSLGDPIAVWALAGAALFQALALALRGCSSGVRPSRQEEARECWRAVLLVGRTPPTPAAGGVSAVRDDHPAFAMLELMCPLLDTISCAEGRPPSLPASPALAAAADAGLLPALEGLCRRGALNLQNPHAGVVVDLVRRPHTASWLRPLLASSDPGAVAAWAGTLAKRVRRIKPHLLIQASPFEPGSIGHALQFLMTHTLQGALDYLPLCCPEAPGEEAGAGAGDGVGEAAARGRRLALILAAVRILPELSRLVRSAAALAGTQGGGGGSGDSEAAAAGAAAASAATSSASAPGSAPAGLETAALGAQAGQPQDGATAPAADGEGSPASARPLEGLALDPALWNWVRALSLAQLSARTMTRPLSDPGPAPAADWRAWLAGDVAVVELVGAALCSAEHLWASEQQLGPEHRSGLEALARACVPVSVLFAPEVMRAAASDSSSDSGASGVSGGGCGGRGGVEGSESGSVPAAFPWRPSSLRLLARQTEACGGDADAAAAVRSLATALEQQNLEAGSSYPGRILSSSSATVFEIGPWEAEELLPVCGNPACVSLAGDSEAGLRLQQCGRCRRVSYCCKECQMAHWRAGHEAACEAGRAGG
ncbi:hypothetical protein HYH03_016655 [Edaphochlamys debaryana]|uniref:MYND-type domain-containing protein n=1 Tax=Edaphochlamys debaryana TaxID=47281 RepID=A0A835XJG0_9CHLO|nr:hypothetical protein HYH03_016655 [Edaphochlamys debaryana]|eukprot:KAG2484515.1 hypothetical protein HYH03_016655 [Edaphochlamys debaryana]